MKKSLFAFRIVPSFFSAKKGVVIIFDFFRFGRRNFTVDSKINDCLYIFDKVFAISWSMSKVAFLLAIFSNTIFLSLAAVDSTRAS